MANKTNGKHIGNDQPRDPLETAADDIIRKSNAAAGEYPAYSEDYLMVNKKMHGRPENRVYEVSIEMVCESVTPIPSLASLIGALMPDIARAAGRCRMDNLEYETFKLYCQGHTQEVIAGILDISQPTVSRALNRACVKLRKDKMFGLLTDLLEKFHKDAYLARSFGG